MASGVAAASEISTDAAVLSELDAIIYSTEGFYR